MPSHIPHSILWGDMGPKTGKDVLSRRLAYQQTIHYLCPQIHHVMVRRETYWTTITDNEGTVEQELSFDAWGNRRNPDTWKRFWYDPVFEEPMFDRGFTGHEHLYAFGLINMNGRCYDPMVSSFLSVDAFVDEPTCAQGFNRYAYCMYNPLKYVDPSGWQKVGGMRPRNEFHDDWSNSHVVPVHSTSDFTNAYYLSNLSLYGNFDGPCGGTGYTMDDLVNTYGYQVTHYANSVYNYCFRSTQKELIRNWQYNPNKTTSLDLEEAGIHYLSISVTKPGNGTQNSYYTWTSSNGKIYYAEALNEYIGWGKMDSYCLSFKPQETKGSSFTNNSFNHFDESACGIITLIGGAAKGTALAYRVPGQPIPKSPFTKISTFGSVIGGVAVMVNARNNYNLVKAGQMSAQEGMIRSAVSLVEFGVTFIPYIGPILSIAITAYDINGGFDNNLYSIGKH